MSVRIAKAFEHLDRLSDRRGLFEHAKGIVRREEHGYCTDDNARLLVVTSREEDVGRPRVLSRMALDFVLAAQHRDGRSRNRMNHLGQWTDQAGTDDGWGRSVWALGAAAAGHHDEFVRASALAGFDRGVRQRSRWPRAMAFASLGAADVLIGGIDHQAARELLVDTLDVIGPTFAGAWSWPEPRLRYANAALAEAVIAAGFALGNDDALDHGLTMLAWLLELETRRGHLSITGVDGRGPNDDERQFDQQAIEAAAMADACWRALTVTADSCWISGVNAAAQWFGGHNDTGAVMYDSESGGAYDGLQRCGVNINQGAESTLALVSTMQRARLLVATP